jgi:hypothetical protein
MIIHDYEWFYKISGIGGSWCGTSNQDKIDLALGDGRPINRIQKTYQQLLNSLTGNNTVNCGLKSFREAEPIS